MHVILKKIFEKKDKAKYILLPLRTNNNMLDSNSKTYQRMGLKNQF